VDLTGGAPAAPDASWTTPREISLLVLPATERAAPALRAAHRLLAAGRVLALAFTAPPGTALAALSRDILGVLAKYHYDWACDEQGPVLERSRVLAALLRVELRSVLRAPGGSGALARRGRRAGGAGEAAVSHSRR